MDRSVLSSNAASEPEIDPVLRNLLVCPVEQGALYDVEKTLVCSICGRVFPIEDGIPNMIVPLTG